MLVIATDSALYCSEACFDASGLDPIMDGAKAVPFPGRQRNRVLDILVGRATCDACGFNLEDLAADTEVRTT